VEYYTREMGQLAGRLMAALSLLVDLEDSYGWRGRGKQASDAVRYSRLLVASVLLIVATAQLVEGGEMEKGRSIDEHLHRFSRGEQGGTQ
jgi:hypothetical protein